MYTQKMIYDLFKEKKTDYLYVIGYDGDKEKGYTDIMVQASNTPPDVDNIEFYMDLYKPLEVRGSLRRLVWCDCFSKKGKIDLNALFNDGVLQYSYLVSDFEKE